MKKHLLITLALSLIVGVSFAQAGMDTIANIYKIQSFNAPTIDGTIDGIWDYAEENRVDTLGTSGDPANEYSGLADLSGYFKALYDDNNIYFLFNVTDDVIVNDNETPGGPNDDGFDLAFDWNYTRMNERVSSADRPDESVGYVIASANFSESGNTEWQTGPAWRFVDSLDLTAVQSRCALTDNGYVIEMSLELDRYWPDGITADQQFGLGVRFQDDDQVTTPGARVSSTSWDQSQYFESRNGWNKPSTWGTAIFKADLIETSISDNEINSAAINVYPNPANNVLFLNQIEMGAEINIISITGQTMLSTVASSTNVTLDITDLNTGLYFVQVNDAVVKVSVK